MLAVVEALLFSIDGYEVVPERTTSAQQAIREVFNWHDGAGRSENVIDCNLDDRDVLYDRLQAV
jgi:hypothetical protein